MPLARSAPDVEVYIDGALASDVVAIDVRASSGGKSLDSATLRKILTRPNENGWIVKPIQEVEIVVRKTQSGLFHWNKEELKQFQALWGDNSSVIFWGQISGIGLSIGKNEDLTFEAKQAQFHFGFPVTGAYELANGEMIELPGDLVFNPVLRDVVRGNLGRSGNLIYFLDPQRVATSVARRKVTGKSEEAGGPLASDEFWTLRDAVYYLCQDLNDETYIKNPTDQNLDLLKSADTTKDRPLQNVRIPMGTFLPQALDTILDPFGFGWCIDYEAIGFRRIRIFRRGVGQEKTLLLQPYKDDLDVTLSNIEASRFGVGYQSLYNQITVIGDNELHEATFELIPAWSSELDGTAETYLTLGHEDYASDKKYHRVRRDWVLNEAGDYEGTRSGYDEPFDWSSVVDESRGFTVPRRRRFLPCITVDADRLPLGKNGFVLEFKTSSDADWLPIEQLEAGSFEILTQECGIRFTADIPPYVGTPLTDFKLRITASVYSDSRLKYVAERSENSIQPLVSDHVIDARDKFKFAAVSEASKFYGSSSYESTEIDDTLRIKEFAERLRKTWNQADVSSNVTIPWLDLHNYSIGDVITFVSGRDIQLSTGSVDGDKFPQVVGIHYDCQRHKRTLALEVFRDARFA